VKKISVHGLVFSALLAACMRYAVYPGRYSGNCRGGIFGYGYKSKNIPGKMSEKQLYCAVFVDAV